MVSRESRVSYPHVKVRRCQETHWEGTMRENLPPAVTPDSETPTVAVGNDDVRLVEVEWTNPNDPNV